MEKRTLLAVLLTMVVLTVWQSLFPPSPPPVDPPERASETVGASGSTGAVSPAGQPAPSIGASPANVSRILELNGPNFRGALSTDGGGPVNWHLLEYQAPSGQKGLLSWLWHGISSGLEFGPLVVPSTAERLDVVHGGGASFFEVRLDSAFSSAPVGREVIEAEAGSVLFGSQWGSVALRERWVVDPSGYALRGTITLANSGATQVTVPVNVVVRESLGVSAERGMLRTWIGSFDGDIEDESLDGLGEGESAEYEGKVGWFGVMDNYFLTAMLFPTAPEGKVKIVRDGNHVSAAMSGPSVTLPPGGQVEQQVIAYLGPKRTESMRAISPDLEGATNYGMLTIFAVPLLFLLKFFNGVFHSYGVAIVLMTVTVKAVTFPLTQRSLESMQRMKEIQPEINRLKEKFGEHQEVLNQEMMKLFAEKKINPLGGCLPTLVQIPVWFALFQVLQNAVELYHTPFLYLDDLAAADPYGVSPVLLAVAMLVQQRMTPMTNVDPMQAKMLQWMPLIFAFMMFGFPSGLVLYSLVNAVLSILQQWWLNKKMASPAKG